MQLLLAAIWFFVFLVASATTFEFLVSTDPKKQVLQFVPVLCIVFMAVGITAMCGTYLRLRGARMKFLIGGSCSCKMPSIGGLWQNGAFAM